MLTLLLISCKGEKAPPPVQPSQHKSDLTLRIVHNPYIADYLDAVKNQFILQKPSLSDGRSIGIEYLAHKGIDAAEKIASGKIKVDGWIAPSYSLVNFANSKLRNLGPPQVDCRQLFASPVVLAVHKKSLELMGVESSQVLWKVLFADRSKLEEDKDIDRPIVTLSHGTPASPTGLSALIQLTYLANSEEAKALSLNSIKSEYGMTRLKYFENFGSQYDVSEGPLLEKVSTGGGSIVRMVLTTEQQMSRHNLTHGSNSNLVAVYPEEGSYWQDYSLCYSDADWVPADRKAALKMFTNFLASPDSQYAVKRLGFRPAVADTPEVAPLTLEYGVNTSLPHKSLLPVPGDVVSYLLDAWPKLKRPSATVLVLDTSGSMEGDPLIVALQQLRLLVGKMSPQDLMAIVTFSTSSSIQSNFTGDRKELLRIIDSLKTSGGSAMYDALRSSLQLITQADLKTYRKNLVLLTNGDDTSSDTPLPLLISMIRNTTPRQDIHFSFVGIGGADSDFNSLKDVVDAADGNFRQRTIHDLYDVFAEIARTIE